MGPVGVLCTDTRMNLQAADGTWTRNDTGIQRFARRDGSTLEIPEKKRKMRGVPSGWLAASSSSHLLSEAVFNALADRAVGDPSEIYRTARSVLREQGDALRTEFSNPDPRDHLNLIYLFGQGRGFNVGHCTVGGDDQSSQVSDYALSLPDDFDVALHPKLNEMIRKALFVPKNASGLWQLVRAVAAIVHLVHTGSESVSDHMDCVMLVRDATAEGMVLEWYGRSSEILGADDATISASLTASKE